MTSFLFQPRVQAARSIENEVFRNFFISQPVKLKFGTGIQNSMLSLISGSKSGFRDHFGQYDTKTIILRQILAVFLPNASSQ